MTWEQIIIMAFRKEEQLNYDRGSMAGILHLYRSEAKFQVAKKELVALKQRFGPHLKNHAVWDAEKCIFHEPSLKNSRAKISGGIWWEGNESGDCNMFTQGLADICEHKYGVTFLYSTNISTLQRHPNNPLRVSGIVTEEGVEVKADKVVVCLGSYTSQLLRHSLGLWLPIFPIKGYSLTLKLPPEGFVPSGTFPLINLADIESKTYFARLVGSQGSRLRIVGMGELCGYDPTIDRTKEGIANLTTSSTQLFPELRRHHLNEASLWACLRAVTPCVHNNLLLLFTSSLSLTPPNNSHNSQGFSPNDWANQRCGKCVHKHWTWQYGMDIGLWIWQSHSLHLGWAANPP